MSGLGSLVRRPARGSVRLIHGDARKLDRISSGSVHLVVTSPPYPMIPQWDSLFRALGATDYAGMLRVLSDAWAECHRVLVTGGILAVNIGDALRSEHGEFRLWPNPAETLVAASHLGFVPLPYLLWKKPTNRPNAFLGSGFLPPNAYVTLDCEFVLLFRKGPLRRFPPHDAARLASQFSRPERDRWFSQVWTDIRGARQDSPRGRNAAFPPELAERLVRMFSVAGDTVLDPFAGTGTTLWAAARWGREAIGVEWDGGAYGALEASARTQKFTSPARTTSPRRAAGAVRRGGRAPRPPRA
ncbi:MAG TPA: site-specific DNA-methyltransferase [Thermoplasmata archaeon]|nr:site-specific DNA-methyltransferase [Thermoplasmata archaeon]